MCKTIIVVSLKIFSGDNMATEQLQSRSAEKIKEILKILIGNKKNFCIVHPNHVHSEKLEKQLSSVFPHVPVFGDSHLVRMQGKLDGAGFIQSFRRSVIPSFIGSDVAIIVMLDNLLETMLTGHLIPFENKEEVERADTHTIIKLEIDSKKVRFLAA